jgi:hypothetical protein
MGDPNVPRPGFRARWAASSTKDKNVMIGSIILMILIVVLGIIPLMEKAYRAGQQAVR